jgi:hypothetical protein
MAVLQRRPWSAHAQRAARPRFSAFAYGQAGDHESCDRVHPPPSEDRVGYETQQHHGRKVRAQLGLGGISAEGDRVQTHGYATLGPGQA